MSTQLTAEERAEIQAAITWRKRPTGSAVERAIAQADEQLARQNEQDTQPAPEALDTNEEPDDDGEMDPRKLAQTFGRFR